MSLPTIMTELLNEHPGPAFALAFGPEAQDLLVRALRRAYETVCEHHDPARGADAQTFGFCAYKYAAFEIDREAKTNTKAITVSSRNPIFRFVIGGFELACHRVGDSEHDDIAVSFPGNNGAVVQMIEEQLWLDNVPRGQALTDARSVVLAHMGNPEDGLRAVYLCIAEEAKDGRISRWAYSELVWRADLDATISTTTSVTERAPVEHVEAPRVVRRARKVSDGENG
jgi:hypothetical protein